MSHEITAVPCSGRMTVSSVYVSKKRDTHACAARSSITSSTCVALGGILRFEPAPLDLTQVMVFRDSAPS
jgi:hypothetical protein